MVAFPNILAASFAGFYLALFLLLWALVLRGVSIEVSGHIADPLWRTAWHFIFVGSNVLLAILIGAALGNVLRGVPLKADGKFALAFFTNFSPRGNVGILDWFTMSVAVFILITLAAHGATALVMKTDGPVQDRSRKIAGMLWKIVLVLLIIITIESCVGATRTISLECCVKPFWLAGADLRRQWDNQRLYGSTVQPRIAWRHRFRRIRCRTDDCRSRRGVSGHATFDSRSRRFLVGLSKCGHRSWAGYRAGLVAARTRFCHSLFFVHLPALLRQGEPKGGQSKSILAGSPTLEASWDSRTECQSAQQETGDTIPNRRRCDLGDHPEPNHHHGKTGGEPEIKCSEHHALRDEEQAGAGA